MNIRTPEGATVNLYLLRHADAGSRESWPGDDADRPLSEYGHAQARALADAFRHREMILDAVVTSPYLRAVETGIPFLSNASPSLHPLTTDLLAAGELRPRRLSNYLAELGLGNVLIIGHDPDLPQYLAYLLGAEPEHFHLDKCGVALVRFSEKPSKAEGRLVWLINEGWVASDSSNRA